MGLITLAARYVRFVQLRLSCWSQSGLTSISLYVRRIGARSSWRIVSEHWFPHQIALKVFKISNHVSFNSTSPLLETWCNVKFGFVTPNSDNELNLYGPIYNPLSPRNNENDISNFHIDLQFGGRLVSSVAETPVAFQSHPIILDTNLTAVSRVRYWKPSPQIIEKNGDNMPNNITERHLIYGSVMPTENGIYRSARYHT